MISQHLIDQANQVSIAAYLQAEGFKPIKKWKRNTRFENPLREEQTPSFDVDEKNNHWFDRGTGEGGDMIRLFMYYKKCTFQEAVAELTNQIDSFSFRQQGINKPTGPIMQQFMVQDLTEPRLLAYLRKRKIDLDIARKYLKEAHYEVKGKLYFTLAFPSQKDGYELRNAFFKGCYGPKAISAFKSCKQTSNLLLFEGFMDFLTYLTRANQSHPNDHVIVLNTTALLTDSLIEKMSRFTVHAYLDNDPGGRQTMVKLKDNHVVVSDHSIEYTGYKDLNEYHMHTVS